MQLRQLAPVVGLLMTFIAQPVLGVELSNPRDGAKYYKNCANIGCLGTAKPGDTVVIEVTCGGVIQARQSVTANAKGDWLANIKMPPAGWIVGEGSLTARVGKSQASAKIRFVDIK